MIREHTNHVLVMRQDAGGVTFASGGLNNTKRGTGIALDLPDSESDVANALTRSGGLPGLEARNEVIVVRGQFKPGPDGNIIMPDVRAIADDRTGQVAAAQGIKVTRIPLRLRPGDTIPFKPTDIELRSGDIVFIDARDTELFYTGGLLPAREVVLPRDYDLDVVEAIAQGGGTLLNGGQNSNNLSGAIFQAGIGVASPNNLTVIRRLPHGKGEVRIQVDLDRALRDPRERIKVEPGDILILQETIGQAFVRYFTSIVNFQSAANLFTTPDAIGTGSIRFP